MLLQAADELVALLAQTHPALVLVLVPEQHVGVAIPEAHVHVAAVAGQMAEGLGHEGGDQPALLRHRLDHVAVEDRSVAAGQRVRRPPVLLELPVGVLMVGRVQAPSQ